MISIDLILAVALVALPIWQGHSRKIRVICAAILLTCQLCLLGPTYAVLHRSVPQPSEEKGSSNAIYREAWFDGLDAMKEQFSRVLIPPLFYYTVALTILVLFPYRQKKGDMPSATEPQQCHRGVTSTRGTSAACAPDAPGSRSAHG